jgi:hypothetical protein
MFAAFELTQKQQDATKGHPYDNSFMPGASMSDQYKERIFAALTRNYERTKKKRVSDDEVRAAWKSTSKRKKQSTGKVPTERQEQVRLAKHLDSLGLLWCHVPNEGHGGSGKGAKIRGAMLRAEGLKSGVPDVLIFDHCEIEKDGRKVSCSGCAIELKRSKGGRVSDSQKEWLDSLEKRGWYTAVCKGFDEARELIERLGYAKNTSK